MSVLVKWGAPALALILLGAAPAAARAQDGEEGPSYDARIRRALDTAASDRAAAMTAFRDATAADPSRPDAYCYMGELSRMDGELATAIESFQTCLNVAHSAHSHAFAARAAHGIAQTFERMGPEHYADARTAWLAYERLTEHPLVLPEIGREREAVIDAFVQLTEACAAVRTRIAEREAAAAAAASEGGAAH